MKMIKSENLKNLGIIILLALLVGGLTFFVINKARSLLKTRKETKEYIETLRQEVENSITPYISDRPKYTFYDDKNTGIGIDRHNVSNYIFYWYIMI